MSKHPTLCLNMIVKNESHIIKKTLTNICNKFIIDYWVISDTGSTDSTIEIIEEFFKEKNIPGKIYNDEWVNFAHNRTLALEHAFNKTDLLLIFDADDEIIGTPMINYSTDIHGYNMLFKTEGNLKYERICLINNKKIWKYKSVIHEYIYCTESNQKISSVYGNYWIVSGRLGSRNKDPNKYLKDALILEKGYEDEKKINGELIGRYAFYCANSYRDHGNILESIKWYKITLNEKSGWIQEKYISCLEIYRQYAKISQEENGIFYLIESYKYDKERLECIYELIKYYCIKNMNEIAMNFYNLINFELKINTINKLFIEQNIYDFYLPYYMIIVSDRVNNKLVGISMYEKIFKLKPEIFGEWWIKNLLFNLRFFNDYVPENKKTDFFSSANEYINFLFKNNVQLNKFDFLKDYKDNLIIDFIFPQNFKQICINSKNILIYTGYSNNDWNYSYLTKNALGGSEKAVAYVSKYFSKDYHIYISGGVEKEEFENITYVPLNELKNLVKNTYFNTVIVSRYAAFYDMFPETMFFQSYIWAHDMSLLPYGSKLSVDEILNKYSSSINGCICLTEYHKKIFEDKYPILKNKIHLINNGINCENFINANKIKNKFIYSSCVERGLEILIKLWPELLEKIPDATLVIATYNPFPKPDNQFELNLFEEINKYSSIKYLGNLSTDKLYQEMATSEFWLYTCIFPETSCITALEMLMSGVIPIYYSYAGLPYTINGNGIQTSQGNEINDILKLNENEENKKLLVKKGIEYAQTCSWELRAREWEKILFAKNIAIFNSFDFHYEMFGYIINYCKNNNYNLTIFTSTINNLGYIDFYKNIFYNYKFEYKNINAYEIEKELFDITFVTTDEDYKFKEEWINDKCITIDHTNKNRRSNFKYHIGTRSFADKNNLWAIPCFNIFEPKDKLNMFESQINIAIIGISKYLKTSYNIINRLCTNNNLTINLHLIGRTIYEDEIKSLINSNICISLYENMDTNSMFNLLKICDYILTDVTSNLNHINGITMSGSIPIAFSTLTPLIISKTNNSFYKFKNVIEFDLYSTNKIIVNKNIVNVKLLVNERNELITMFNTNINNIINNVNIPKNIIQIWENKNFEPEFQEIIDSWKHNNPNYKYHLFDKNERIEFIKNNFKQEILDTYNSIIPGAYKADLFRYCYLYIYGGIYVDIDTLCIGKLDNFLLPNIDFIVPIDLNISSEEGKHNLCNGFIASIPKHPVLLECINKIVYNVKNNIIPPSKLDFTGPGILGRSVNIYFGNNETDSFVNKEGIYKKFYFLKFEAETEYVKDLNNNLLFQNKNKNSKIINLYNYECSKLSNYVSWVSCPNNKIIK